VTRLRGLFAGGSAANEQLTAVVAAVLLPLLAAEGATLLSIRSLLTVHAFVGMLLIPVVALKLASTGWRLLRHYRGDADYVLRGPPHATIRFLVAPVVVAATLLLFGTGVALLAVDEREGALVGLHKASFVVWFGALSLHVLTRVPSLLRAMRRRLPGLSFRVTAAALSVSCGIGLAALTLPAIDHMQDNMSAHLGVDSN
jgi:MFS family permease